MDAITLHAFEERIGKQKRKSWAPILFPSCYEVTSKTLKSSKNFFFFSFLCVFCLCIFMLFHNRNGGIMILYKNDDPNSKNRWSQRLGTNRANLPPKLWTLGSIHTVRFLLEVESH